MHQPTHRTFKSRLALIPAICAFCLSACASQQMQSHTRAWELVEGDEMAQTAKPKTAAKRTDADKVVYSRKAVWLDPYADGDYYDQTPTARAIAAREGTMPASNSMASLDLDGRSPTGWTHRELVANWGPPAQIKGSLWIYRSKSGADCATVELSQGVVTSATRLCR